MTDTFPYVIGIVNFSSVTWGWDGLYKETIIVSVRQRELPLMTELALASFSRGILRGIVQLFKNLYLFPTSCKSLACCGVVRHAGFLIKVLWRQKWKVL